MKLRQPEDLNKEELQFFKFMSSYLHYMSVFHRPIGEDKFKIDIVKGFTNYEMEVIRLMLKDSGKSPNVTLNIKSILILKEIDTMLRTGNPDKHNFKVMTLFMSTIESFKMREFCSLFGVERKDFTSKNVDIEGNYTEIYYNDKLIYAGDYISKKKMFDEPLGKFKYDLDTNEDLLDSLLLKEYHKYYNNLKIKFENGTRQNPYYTSK